MSFVITYLTDSSNLIQSSPVEHLRSPLACDGIRREGHLTIPRFRVKLSIASGASRGTRPDVRFLSVYRPIALALGSDVLHGDANKTSYLSRAYGSRASVEIRGNPHSAAQRRFHSRPRLPGGRRDPVGPEQSGGIMHASVSVVNAAIRVVMTDKSAHPESGGP